MCFSQRDGLVEYYLPVVENFVRGFNILSRYGGTFFTDWQQQQGFEGDLLSDYNWPFERMKEYQDLLEVSEHCGNTSVGSCACMYTVVSTRLYFTLYHRKC